MADKQTILDHIADIRAAGDVFSPPANEYWHLVCLRSGLWLLAEQVSRLESKTKAKADPQGNMRVFGYGNAPCLSEVPKDLLTCYFAWFSVSAVDYAWTVGRIAKWNDSGRPQPRHYVEKVMPAVLEYRDKVGAHLAWARRSGKDTPAERELTVLPRINYRDGVFMVGGWRLTRGRAGDSESADFPAWSITEEYASLAKRYWPPAC
ncbi:MAG: hypothetical protein ACOC8F_06440 [Planctomycetota bacterium]